MPVFADEHDAQPAARGGKLATLFATHPPMAERIARLEAQAGTQGGLTRY